MNSEEKLQRRHEILKKKVRKFIELSQSEEFVNASRFVYDVKKLQDEITKVCKESNITKVEVETEDNIKVLEFDLKVRKVLDKELIPDEILEDCLVEAVTWYKKIYQKDK